MATVSIGSCTDEDELSREETQIYGEPTISRYSGTGGKSEAAKGKGDLKSDETFSVGYARFAYGGLIGGGYHGLGGYGHGGYGYYSKIPSCSILHNVLYSVIMPNQCRRQCQLLSYLYFTLFEAGSPTAQL
jgi:hypothetical protein